MARNKFNNAALQAVLNKPSPTTAAEVAHRLAEIQQELGGFNDPGPLASFNFLYHRITQEIANGVANSQPPAPAPAGGRTPPVPSPPSLQPPPVPPPPVSSAGSSGGPATTPVATDHPLDGHFERSVERARTMEFPPLPTDLADEIEAWLHDDKWADSPLRRLVDRDEEVRAQVLEQIEQIRSGTRRSYLQPVANQLATGLRFKDPEFMDRLDVEFANLYFEALKAWDDDRPVAESWAVLFEHWDDAGEGPVVGALLGVNAHINHDLAIAVVRAHAGAGSKMVDGSDRHDDYLAINGIFEIQIPLLLEVLIGRVTDWRKWLYELAVAAGFVDDVIEWLVIEARDLAWTHAKLIEAGDVVLPAGQSPPIDPVSDPIAGKVAEAILVT